MDSRRQPLTYETYPPASSAPLAKMSAKCGFGHIYEVRLCCLTQNYTNNQSKIRKNASSAFWDKIKKKVLAKQNNAQKVLALSVRD